MLNQKLTGQQAADKTYIEDVFSTYLYTGNGSTQTINNGIDLAGKGGMVWTKCRSNAQSNGLWDTQRGATKYLVSDNTNAESTYSGLTAFNSTGFNLGAGSEWNQNTYTYASWTFRKAPKFFDVVTYTGDGTSNRAISHSLGVAPGMIIIKGYAGPNSQYENWPVYHVSNGAGKTMFLNATSATLSNSFMYFPTAPTASNFYITDDGGNFNSNGVSYVAYLFAHDTTTDGLIQCGSFSNRAVVDLGWEPQYLMLKRTDSAENWFVYDNMRGVATGGDDAYLNPNTSNAETSFNTLDFTATGFNPHTVTSGATYIYMAIRRGPMKTPTDGTKVFSPTTNVTSVTTNFPVDSYWLGLKSGGGTFTRNRLTGGAPYLQTYSTAAEASGSDVGFDSNTGLKYTASTNYINWSFRRALGFFDVVCYTGNFTAGKTVNHNLGAVPELVIVKLRSGATYSWAVYAAPLGNTKGLFLNTTDAATSLLGLWNNTSPTSTVFTLGDNPLVNSTYGPYIAYLFASCPGVSKVGSYTGNGSSQTINCGFTGGARFVLIKRTDSTGDWFVWDTARGITTNGDPHLSLNTTTAEVTSDDTIDPDASGFIVNQVSATNVNVSGASYIYLAIA